MIRPYPLDGVEHELESFSLWLRTHPECPEEVRIREDEGAFERPMIHLSVLTMGIQDDGPYHYWEERSVSLMWYGSPTAADTHYEKNKAATWLSRVLVRNDERLRGLVKIYDFSDPDAPVDTDHWIFINSESVSVQPRRDEYGLWTIAVDLTYTVERSPEFPLPPFVTDVEYTHTLP